MNDKDIFESVDEWSQKASTMTRYCVVFFTSIFVSILYGWYVRAIGAESIRKAIISDITMPLMIAIYTHFFIESKTLTGRLKMALVSGLGYALGSTILLKVFHNHI